MKQKPKANTSENIKERNYVNRRHQLKTTMVYPTTSSGGWGQLPIGFTGYKEAQGTPLQKCSLGYQKEKSIGGVVPLPKSFEQLVGNV